RCMEAHADEGAARVHPYKTIGFAARDLHHLPDAPVLATVAFEAEDTPLTRREIAEAELRRHRRAACLLRGEGPRTSGRTISSGEQHADRRPFASNRLAFG